MQLAYTKTSKTTAHVTRNNFIGGTTVSGAKAASTYTAKPRLMRHVCSSNIAAGGYHSCLAFGSKSVRKPEGKRLNARLRHGRNDIKTQSQLDVGRIYYVLVTSGVLL